MTKRINSIVWTVVLVCVFASCSSTKSLKKVHSIEGMTETEYVETVIANAGGWDALTAKMALSVDLGGKGATKVNGTLRIKKGEVIQISDEDNSVFILRIVAVYNGRKFFDFL